MSTLLPSWLVVIGHVAVHDVNSRYLFYYTSDLHKIHRTVQALGVDLANQWLTD